MTREGGRDVVRESLRSWLVAIGAITLLVAMLARWAGAADGVRMRDRQLADSAAAAAVHQVAVKRRAAIAAGRVFIGTEAPHRAAQEASDRVFARNATAIAIARAARDSARAAAADSSRSLPALRLELRRAADQISGLADALEATRDTVRQERAAAAERIVAAVAAARAQDALVAAQDTLEARRQDQVTTRDAARPPWWRRALGFSCQLATTAGGAGLGAFAGGPGGAMVGAGAGLAGGAIACR